MIHEELRETFWNNHKNIKRKSTQSGKLEAQKIQLTFCQLHLSQLSDEDLNDTFGKFSEFVKKWINAELIKNNFGKHLYVKLGE